MGILTELKAMLKTAGEQITSTSKTAKGLSFTNKFRAQAQSYGLTEKDAEDVYYHGESDKWRGRFVTRFSRPNGPLNWHRSITIAACDCL